MSYQAPNKTANFTADGTATGYVTLASNVGFYVGAKAYIAGTALTTKEVIITELKGTTQVGVRFSEVVGTGRSDISAYTLAAGSHLDMPSQLISVIDNAANPLPSYAAPILPDPTIRQGSLIYDTTSASVQFSNGAAWAALGGGGGGGGITALTGDVSASGSGSVVATVDATSANTASKIVKRDGSGGFSSGPILSTGASTFGSSSAGLYGFNYNGPTVNTVGFGVNPSSVAAGDQLLYVTSPPVTGSVILASYNGNSTGESNVLVLNGNTGSGANASFTIQSTATAGVGGGSAYFSLVRSSAQAWSVGLQGSDTNKLLKFSNGGTPGSGDTMTLNPTTGECRILGGITTGTMAGGAYGSNINNGSVNTVVLGIAPPGAGLANGDNIIYVALPALSTPGGQYYVFNANCSTKGTSWMLFNNNGTGAGAGAAFNISTSGIGGGSPYTAYTVPGQVSWSVGNDNADARRLKFSAGGNPGNVDMLAIDPVTGAMKRPSTYASSAGAQTINDPTGKAIIAAGASSVVITSTSCTVNTLVKAWVQQASADATLTQVIRTSAAAGSFTIYGNANATANTTVGFELMNY